MTGTRDPFKMFSFPVMQSTFCFADVKILAVPTTRLINNFRHLRTVNLIFVGKKGLDAMSALENNPKINAAMKSINAGLWELWWLEFSVCFAVCSKHHRCCN